MTPLHMTEKEAIAHGIIKPEPATQEDNYVDPVYRSRHIPPWPLIWFIVGWAIGIIMGLAL